MRLRVCCTCCFLQFGASNCWTTSGCWPLAPGLFRPLGPPSGLALRVDGFIIQASASTVPRLCVQACLDAFAPWVQADVDAIDGAVPTPGANSTDGLIVFAGLMASVDECQAACVAWPSSQVCVGNICRE